jgi:hypothetical protein
MNYILRRRKLGRTSCNKMAGLSKHGLMAYRNDENLPGKPEHHGNPVKFVFRWGCTSDVPGNPTIVNQAKYIHGVSNKLAFRKLLLAEKLCPETYWQGNFPDHEDEPINFPVIVRPEFHHQGRNFHVCKDMDQVFEAIEKCGLNWYASPLIDKKEEYRVFVVQGRVACVARKYPGNPNQVAWNVYQGGRFENVGWGEWPLKAIKASLRAAELSGLDFCGVDVIVDQAGSPFVLEINSAPSLTSPYRQSCMAKCFDYIVEKDSKKKIPLINGLGGYRKFIHPAVCDVAVMVRELNEEPVV